MQTTFNYKFRAQLKQLNIFQNEQDVTNERAKYFRILNERENLLLASSSVD